MDEPNPQPAGRGGFTLVELMLAIGVIAVLVSLILPAAGRARRQARNLQCVSNLRAIGAACNDYAGQNRGRYPSYETPDVGGNLIAVPTGMYRAFLKLGVPHESLFCPLTEFHDEQQELHARWSAYGFLCLGYHVWIPRRNGTSIVNGTEAMMPPPLDTHFFSFASPPPTTSIQGPTGSGDRKNWDNPIVTDIVRSGYGATPPADANVGVPNPYNVEHVYGHQRESGVVAELNAVYADGRVETIPGSLVRPRYIGTWWHWR
ncbi:MAG TPA: type II secretion system protein [Humisphaera sp.]